MSIGKFLFWSLAFGIAYTQAPLYTSNQNSKFLIGLADAGVGFLKEDWLANTVDPIPVFSFLVYLTYTNLPEYMFYVFNVLMFGVYLYSITGIASRIYHIDVERSQYLTFLAVIIALHSYALDSYSMRTIGIELAQLFHYGVAEQHVIGRIFQPSVFGVFILLSIYGFLCNKVLLAAILVTLPSIFHPAYVLTSAVVTLSYMIIVFRATNSVKVPLVIGILNLLLVLPVLIYFYIQFSPSSAQVWSQASDILVNVRSPHHMKTEVWLGALAYIKVALVIIALYLVKKTRLFTIMCFSLVTAILLAVAQEALDNNTLAASTPWRISVFLVPLSVSSIVGASVSYVFQKYAEPIRSGRRFVTTTSCSAIVVLMLYGIHAQVKRYIKYYSGESINMMNFVKQTKLRGDLYLIPVGLEDFRLYTGTPTFVTWKSGPFKDVEYLQWYKRLIAANDFYEADNGRACKILKTLENDYKITHVVVKSAPSAERCGDLYQLYRDDRYLVYKIQRE